MQIDRVTHDTISTMFREYDRDSHDEIEAMYTGETLDRSAMQRLLEYLRSTTVRHPEASGGVRVTTVVSLDVSVDLGSRLGSVRVTIAGESEIMSAMSVGDKAWGIATVMHKRRLRPAVEVHEHRFRVNMKREEPMNDVQEVERARGLVTSGDRLVYRLKRRFSFPTADKQFRYDITAVRQIIQSRPTWEELCAVPERYEVECEYTGPTDTSTGGGLASSLLKHFGTLLKVLDDTDRLMTVTQRNAVLTEYLTMLYPSEKRVWGPQVVSGQVHHRFLPGPKPVTLEHQHLLESGSKSKKKKGSAPACEDTIAEEAGAAYFSVVGGTSYTVTEKADGVHRVLFVSGVGIAYTMSVEGTLRVRNTGLSCRSGGRGTSSIVDGEFMKESRTSGSIFAAYDALFFEGKDVRRLQLMREEEAELGSRGAKENDKEKRSRSPALSRLSACQIVSSSLAASYAAGVDKTTMHMIVKMFLWYRGDMDGLTSSVRKIMARRDANNFPYSIDGVIFTPASWPMGATTPDGAVKSDASAWHAALKWKPPDQNSIDFLIRLVPGAVVRRNSLTYRVAHLYVGYKPSRWDPVTTLALLTDAAIPSARNAAGEYIEHLFGIPGELGDLHICHLQISERDERITCVSGEDVVDSTIVEFTFDMNAGEDVPRSFRWIPLRPRPDKTQRYLSSGGQISGAANDIASALSVWTSILTPVTEDVMCGRASLIGPDPGSQEDGPSAYYLSKLRPGDGGMASMRDFHNWVKSTDLLMRLKGNLTRSLFDIGCGRAGDLHTWIKMGLARILGVDLYRAGIVDPDNGANVRIMEMRKRNIGKGFPRIVLLPMDASRPIDAAQIETIDDAWGDQHIAKLIWSLVDSSSIKDERLRRYHGFASGGFDTVSCQFAVHYFFGTPSILRAFASNVATNLRRGGMFVGTCMDAIRVDEAFGGKRCIQGVTDGKVIWRIQRLYDNFDKSADCRGNTGMRIKVYVQTIGQVVDEFLVDYRLLRIAMAEVGLLPPDQDKLTQLGLRDTDTEGGTSLFEAGFGRMKRQADRERQVKSALQMSEDEKAFSFLNRWFMFVKS